METRSVLTNPISRGRAARLAWLAALGLVGWLYRRQLSAVDAFRFDDAFITVRYAQQLAHHGVLSFNPDDRIDGYTSVGWTLVLAACEALGLSSAEWMLGLSRLSGLLAILAGMALARRLGAAWPFILAVAALGPLFTPGFIVWSVPGMEMPLAALCYAVALLAMLDAKPAESGVMGRGVRAALLVAAVLVRPEGALLAGMLGMLELALLPRELRSSTASQRLRALAPLLTGALAVGVWMAWRWRFYGHPLPNTFYAKAPTPGLIARGIDDAKAFLELRVLWFALIAALGLIASALPRRTRMVLVLFALWYCAVIVVYARSGGDFPGFHRFYQPLVPASYAVMATFVSRAAAFATAKVGRSHPWLPAAVALAVAVACGSYLVTIDRKTLRHAFAQDQGGIRAQTQAVAEWERAGSALRASWDATRPPMRLAVRAAGVLPHAARADRVYDTLALNNPEVAHHNPAVRDVPAHQKEATDAQVLAWQPNVIVGHPDIEHADLSGTPPGWYDNAAFRKAGFFYRCVPMATPGFFCFWQR